MFKHMENLNVKLMFHITEAGTSIYILLLQSVVNVFALWLSMPIHYELHGAPQFTCAFVVDIKYMA